jgi:hypothetical protein
MTINARTLAAAMGSLLLTTWATPRRSVIFYFEVAVAVNLRLAVNRLVCPGVRRSSGTRDQFFFLLEVSFRQLQLFVILYRPL